MADVRIVSDTPCDCCSTADPACEVECISTQSSGCPQAPTGPGGECESISYPIVGAGFATLQYFIPCSCEQPPAHLVVTAQARMKLTGLTIGKRYTATLIFEKQLTFPIERQFVTYNFTADAAVDYTPYVPVPNPSAEDLPGWFVSGCTIVGAECSLTCHRTGPRSRPIENPGGPGLICFHSSVDDDGCQASYTPIGVDGCGVGCDCPEVPEILAVSVRAHCTGLVPGASYMVSATFEDEFGATRVVTTTFLAAGATQDTDWFAAPTPDADHTTWTLRPACSIQKL